MFCRKCGAVLPDGSAFCPKCGTPVSGAPQGTGVNNSCMGTGIGSRLLSLSSWFSGKGRMARKEFWIRDLLLLCAGYLLLFPFWLMMNDIESYSDSAQAAFCIACVVVLAVFLVMAISGYFIFVRRLHDFSASGYVIIPIIALDALIFLLDDTDDGSFFGWEDLIDVTELFILGCIPGTKGQNRFGPVPKA